MKQLISRRSFLKAAGVTAAAASFQVKHLRADNFKRYIRIVETVAGTDPVFVRAVTFVGKRRA